MKKPIYLDYNATTPVDPRVLESMKPYFTEEFGNPSSSSHSYGWEADMAVSKARKQVAKSIGAKSRDIIFTSGATESNNLAIIGLVRQAKTQGLRPHIITSLVEHKSVLEVFKFAEEFGAEVTYLPVNSYGQVEVETLRQALKKNTLLVSVMFANNEIGSINPVKEIGALTREHGIWFHCDAAQAAGKTAIDVNDLNIDLLSISAHKIYGPKGAGALYVNDSTPLMPCLAGGSQERGIRPGTVNVPGVVGLGKAMEIATEELAIEGPRLRKLGRELTDSVLARFPNARLNGHPEQRLYNNVSFSFSDVPPGVFSLGLKGLAVSSGSACTSASGSFSHVLKAIGHDDQLARNTIRLGLGRWTMPEDIETAKARIFEISTAKSSDIPLG